MLVLSAAVWCTSCKSTTRRTCRPCQACTRSDGRSPCAVVCVRECSATERPKILAPVTPTEQEARHAATWEKPRAREYLASRTPKPYPITCAHSGHIADSISVLRVGALEALKPRSHNRSGAVARPGMEPKAILTVHGGNAPRLTTVERTPGLVRSDQHSENDGNRNAAQTACQPKGNLGWAGASRSRDRLRRDGAFYSGVHECSA